MAQKWHITKKGEPDICKAEIACRLGGEHFATEDDAREAYESDMKDIQFQTLKNSTEDFERKEFFDYTNVDNYTLIDTTTGSIFSGNAVVMEEPEGDDSFYDHPEDFVDMDAEFNVKQLSEATSLEGYNRPVIVELDTGLVVGVKAENIYAVDHSKHTIDFDEILDSGSAASDTAEEKGFRIWD